MLSVFLTDLAAYNAGALIGRWVTLPTSRFELSQIISEILSEGEYAVDGENHEEIFITDYEWSFMTKEIRYIGEYEDVYDLNLEAKLLDELDSRELNAVWFLLKEGIATDTEDAISRAADIVIHKGVAMSKHNQDYATLANTQLIAQAAEYYNNSQKDLCFYREMGLTKLEKMTEKHLMHWKKELHELIFDGLNYHDRRAA